MALDSSPGGDRAAAVSTLATRQPARERARRALADLFPAGVPQPWVLPNKLLDRRVAWWLKLRDLPPVGKVTVLRAAGRRA